MNEQSKNHDTDLELEARIVALVLGEATDVERDELIGLIEVRPELAAVKEEFETVHGLLRDVGSSSLDLDVEDDGDWKLPIEKRSAVLSAMGGQVEESSTKHMVHKLTDNSWTKGNTLLRNLSQIAAVVCIAGFFGLLAMFRSVHDRFSPSSQAPQIARSDESTAVWDREIEGGARRYFDRKGSGVVTEGVNTKGDVQTRTADPKLDFGTSSTSSLEKIRDSVAATPRLPNSYYLYDDVQYLPATPKVSLTQESAPANKPDGLSSVARGMVQPPADFGRLRLSGQQSDSSEGLAMEKLALGEKQNGGQDAIRLGAIVEMELLEQPEASKPAPDIAAIALGTHVPRQDLESSLRKSLQSSESSRSEVGQTESKAGNAWHDLNEGRHLAVNEGLVDGRELAGSKVMSGKDMNGLGIGGGAVGGGAVGGSAVASGGGEFGGRQAAAAGTPGKNFSGTRVIEDQVAMPLGNSSVDSWEQNLARPTIAGMKLEASGNPAEETSRVDGFRAVTPLYSLPQLESKTIQENFKSLPENSPGQASALGGLYGNGSDKDNDQHAALSFQADSIAKGYSELSSQRNAGRIAGKSDYVLGFSSGLENSNESLKLAPKKRAIAPVGLNEINTADDAFSTFSLHVSDVSFKLAQAALAKGEWPEAAKTRIEEFVNAFDYGDPMPSQSERVACRVEQSIHPFLQQRNLLRVSMRTAAAGRSNSTPLRLTFLLDNSGSMERFDRQQTVRRAFALLTQQLTPIDQVTLISFARQPRLMADKISGAKANELVQLIDDLPSEGGTNIEAALQLAFEKAREQQAVGAQNRIVLLTDGAVNLGDANPESLSQMITTMRDAGIAFDAAGISAEGLNDEILEALTRQGDGRYYLLDSAEAADESFARQIAGALRPSAKNVKVQIEFNPKRVGHYKLLGFEKHLLNQEDFRNDKVDAAEMAAAEAGVAMYQFEAKPDGEGDIGTVSVRFLDMSTGQMVEKRWPIPYDSNSPRPDQAAPSLRIAASAALFAAKLRDEPLGESVELNVLSDLIAGLPERVRNVERVGQLQQMIEQARQIKGN